MCVFLAKYRGISRGSVSNRVALILLLAVSFLSFSKLSAQTELIKKPQDVIQIQDVNRLEADVSTPQPDCGGVSIPGSIIARASQQISLYTSQFIEGKKIQDERNSTRTSFLDMDVNAVRLLTLRRNMQYPGSFFLGEFPLMYRLHTVLGKCYASQDETYRALAEYAMAFRYTGMEFWKEPADQTEREGIYSLMLDGFADVNRTAQESDPDIKQAAERFRQLMSGYENLKNTLTEAKKEIDVAVAARARGLPGPTPEEAKSRADSLQTQMDQLTANLEEIRKNQYRKYYDLKRTRDGNLAFEMANLVKKLEIDNKNLARILNRSSYYRGLGGELGEERTELRNFVGYAIFLELAQRIDPENLRYLTLLSSEYRNSRQVDRAIAFEEKYIELAGRMNPPPAELPERMLALAGMFTDVRNFVRAGEAYEKYLALEKEPEKARKATLDLADLYFHDTGNFERAEELYRSYLRDSLLVDETKLDYRIRNEVRSTRFRIFKNLASIDRRHSRPAKEREDLSGARTQFAAIEKDFSDYETQENKIRSSILEIKKQLLSRENEDLQKEYYRLLRIDLPAVREVTDFLRVRMSSLNLPVILERMALISIRDRNFNDSLDLYREIVRRGTGDQTTRARRNIELVNLTMTDGILRSPVVDPAFER